MQQVVCPLSIVPVRKEPSDRAEQVTQWLFGETADVLEKREKWSQLKFHHDGYEGWVDNKQCVFTPSRPSPVGKETMHSAERFALTPGPVLDSARTDRSAERGEMPVRSAEQFARINTKLGPMVLPFGAVLPSYSSGQFKYGDEDLAFVGRISATITGTPIQRLLALKDQWLNTPYLWGGRSPFGVDCSGLTQMLFLVCGVALPRDAWQQAEVGTSVDLIDLATTGDLAFFDNAEGRIVHVGIVLEDRKILHASGRVRIDPIDQEGIFSGEEKRYSHTLRLVKRVV